MLPSLREILALPSFRAAGAEVLTGNPDTTIVRWVHSSEVYEMGGLLAGGELLLTTGLGLHARSAAQLTAYVDQIADAGSIALAMELGRSFFAIPAELLDAARRRDLALLALHAVVPFERMVEDFHDLLVQRQFASTRAKEPVWQELLGMVVAGQGMTALLNTVSRLAGCCVELHDGEERVLERSRNPAPRSDTESTTVDVRGPAGSLGKLVLAERPTARRTAVANCSAVAVALELGRHLDVGQRPSPAQAVIADLAAGLVSSGADMGERLAAANFTPVPDQHVLVAAVDIDTRTPIRDLIPTVRDAVATVLGSCLVASLGHHVIVLARGWPTPSLLHVRESFIEVHTTLRRGESAAAVRAVGVATPVSDLSDVGAAITQARDVVQIARRLGIRSDVHLARDVGVQRLLASGSGPSELAEFVNEQLGPLISYDTLHCADLVRTLDAYLRGGGSKSRTAAALGIRRQSLYARLGRIERLLGVAPDDPAQALCLGVAMTAWRMRTGLDPQAAFDRRG